MRRVLFFILVSLFAASCAAAGDWLEVAGPPELVFPRDHGAHPDYRTEWWYVTGLVDADDGRRFGFQVTFFRQGLDPSEPETGSSRLRARQIVAAHLAVADISNQRFHHAERLRRSVGGLAGFSDTGLDVWLDDWEMKTDEAGVVSVQARDAATGVGVDFELRPQRELVLHGDRGYSRKGADEGNASAYVSWTRLAVEGQLEVEGSLLKIDGTAWFDHEWGTSQLGEGVAGWDWFSLRLDDGRDLMVYRLRRADGSADPRSSGTLVGPNGGVQRLDRDGVELEVLGWWQSPATGARYPVRWRLRVPDAGIDLEISSLLTASELDGSATTGVVYWEGPVTAIGSTRGEGYVEMTGYAGTLEDRF
ncbi:MAG: lipocalin-like domain-containing protein [Acidobacteriota bacterium]|nr:lipocalin-like domain-containing protein [Acidobacteriota bacterium]